MHATLTPEMEMVLRLTGDEVAPFMTALQRAGTVVAAVRETLYQYPDLRPYLGFTAEDWTSKSINDTLGQVQKALLEAVAASGADRLIGMPPAPSDTQ